MSAKKTGSVITVDEYNLNVNKNRIHIHTTSLVAYGVLLLLRLYPFNKIAKTKTTCAPGKQIYTRIDGSMCYFFGTLFQSRSCSLHIQHISNISNARECVPMPLSMYYINFCDFFSSSCFAVHCT